MPADRTTTTGPLSRRTLLTGIGAGALAAGLGRGAPSASAAPALIRPQNAKADQLLATAIGETGQEGQPKGYSKYNYAKNWKSPMSSDHHAAWCAMFLSWCFDQNWGTEASTRAIGLQTGMKYPTGWSATWLWRDYLRGNDQWVGWEAAEPGDLVFFKFGDNGNPTDHVGMVSDPHSTNTYTLIEGNIPGDDNRVVKQRDYTRSGSLVAVYRPIWSTL